MIGLAVDRNYYFYRQLPASASRLDAMAVPCVILPLAFVFASVRFRLDAQAVLRTVLPLACVGHADSEQAPIPFPPHIHTPFPKRAGYAKANFR